MALARFQSKEVEPLSPRSANIPPKTKASKTVEAKEMLEDEAKKVEAAKKAAKEKEYASVPPEWVFQPAITKDGQSEKYKTGRLLGKGGFAMAYEAEFRNRNSAHDRKVFALKVVRAKMSQRKMEDKFRTELQIHAKMRHPNIVEFHRAFTYRDSTYVVLEMCPNGSVMDMVKKRRCLTLPEVRRLMIQLCGAIKYMHMRNVIHRDLKMGNLFLDQDMNLKIGDFGLAAVLVSKDELEGICDYAKSRRTTLCGTPNYIAPEILEKGKGGHDYKVDIWAIGVILFAMIAGQPPFQSSSQNEIYKRARNVDYTWPQEGKCHNDIPEEAKDLVARLLKVDAEQRPDPDLIVGHSFFSMHGGDAIPAKMEEHFRVEKPHYLDQKARPRGDVMIKGTERLSLRSLAKHCGVGHLPGCVSPQATVGADIDLSLYKECAAEEAAGLGPVVPVPKDMVYVSKYSFGAAPSTKQSSEGDSSIILEKKEEKRSGRSEMLPPRARFETARRAPIQSHAATLRAAPFASKVGLSRLDPQLLDIDTNKAVQKAETIGAGRARRGLLNELPVRPSGNVVSAAEVDDKVDKNQRTTRSRKPAVLKVMEASEPKEEAPPRRAITKDDIIEATSPDPDKKRRQLAARTRARIASNVQKEFEDELDKPTKSSLKAVAKAPTHMQYMLGPDEIVENLPSSRADAVLEGLRTLRDNLTATLQAVNGPPEYFDRQVIEAGKRSNKQRPVLVKWVDYTNKFGISYILADGTVGCLFKGEGNTPNPTCIVVPDAETHLKKRKTIASYRERDQIVSRKGEAVQFIEDCGDDGLRRVCIAPSMFQVKAGEKLAPGKDTWEFEKRRKLCLWDKFGKYMTQSLATPSSDPSDLDDNDELSLSTDLLSNKQKAVDNGIFIKFYQRLDNVGIWGFGSGGFQFNFPDHTKLYIDSKGLWADFYHLPLPAARALKSGQQHPLDPADLADRSVLCLPIATLLRGQYTGSDDVTVRVGKEVFAGKEVEGYVRDIVLANEFEKKARFVARVVGVWVKEQGLGRMGRRKGWRWEGMADKRSVKRVWDSVGARGGDERYEVVEGAEEGN